MILLIASTINIFMILLNTINISIIGLIVMIIYIIPLITINISIIINISIVLSITVYLQPRTTASNVQGFWWVRPTAGKSILMQCSIFLVGSILCTDL